MLFRDIMIRDTINISNLYESGYGETTSLNSRKERKRKKGTTTLHFSCCLEKKKLFWADTLAYGPQKISAAFGIFTVITN